MQTEHKKKKHGLARSLAIYFLLLSLFILVFSTGLQLFFNYQSQTELIAAKQNNLAQLAAEKVKNFIKDKLTILQLVTKANNPTKATALEKETILDKIISLDSSLQQLVLLDLQGKELAKASRLSSLRNVQLGEQTKERILQEAKGGRSYISDVYINETTSEPLILIASPVKDVLGDVKEVVVAEVNLKFTWDLVGNINVGEGGTVFVVDDKGNLIAYKDINRVLKRENLSNLREIAEFMKDKNKEDSKKAEIVNGIQRTVVVATYVPLDSPSWAVVVESPVFEAYKPIVNNVTTSLIIIALSIVFTVLIGIYLSERLAKPIVHLRDAAIKIGEGTLTTKIPIETNDEIGELGETFNQMTTKLEDYQQGLEQKVEERTKALDAKIKELEKIQKLTVGRELKMIELKKEIVKLRKGES
jgi:methyl-accepting chemotaxis protein